MWRIIFLLVIALQGVAFGQVTTGSSPYFRYGQLFKDVQLKKIFPDGKTFTDCVPLYPPDEIAKRYEIAQQQPGFDLENFVLQHFQLPPSPPAYASGKKDIRRHMTALWKVLKRSADSVQEGSSLIPLPHPYIVPGGRFREVYYWDSYFTMLGLKESGEYDLMENIIQNFAWLINTFGHVPNGNRTYYISRSQPPFFSLMVELLASVKGDKVYTQYHDALLKESDYWTQGSQSFRYHDELFIPREESYLEDHATATKAVSEFRKRALFADTFQMKHAIDSVYAFTCNNLRSAAASGWDFSSRWMQGDQLHTTATGSIMPVDLQVLIHHLRTSGMRDRDTNTSRNEYRYSSTFLRNTFFNEKLGWYCDYDVREKKVMDNPTLAGMYPLFFKLADKKDVPRIVAFLKKHFLKPGGVVTSLNNTGQQWDAPNGWAPLQWITIIGLENYGYHQLAKEIAGRWVRLNKKVFDKTGRLMEKYDVINISRPAGGGEYPSQDGFGWTNGVLLALMNKYKW